MTRKLLPVYRLSSITLFFAACESPGPVALSAEEVGVVTQPETISGRDGGGSAEVFGQSVWTSGDTVLAVPDEVGQTWHNNSYAFAEGEGGDFTLTDPTDSVGAPRLFMAPTAFEAAFNADHFGEECAVEPCSSRWANWPGTPAWDADNNRALVTYAILYLGEDEENHVGGGHSVAVWDDVEAQPVRPEITAGADFPDMLWGPDDGDWGTASAISDGYFYVFSCDEGGLDRPCRLGRAALDEVQSPSTWAYYDGEDWGEMADATMLFSGAPIMSLGWNDYLSAWLMMYSPPFAGAVYARVSSELWGPWSAASLIYSVPASDPPYDANHHPELAEEGGKIDYVTWSRGTDGWFGSEFAVLRVEWE